MSLDKEKLKEELDKKYGVNISNYTIKAICTDNDITKKMMLNYFDRYKK